MSDSLLTCAYRTTISLKLDFFYRLYQLSSGLQLSREKEDLDTSNPLTAEKLSALTLQEREQDVQWLRNRLRSTPYWLNGHRSLAFVSLELGDTATAYASAHAMLALSKSKEVELGAQRIMGKCYLKQGQHQQALSYLSAIHKDHPHDYEVIEDLAATYMTIDNNEEAKRLLNNIPTNRLSREGAAALDYLKNKE